MPVKTISSLSEFQTLVSTLNPFGALRSALTYRLPSSLPALTRSQLTFQQRTDQLRNPRRRRLLGDVVRALPRHLARLRASCGRPWGRRRRRIRQGRHGRAGGCRGRGWDPRGASFFNVISDHVADEVLLI